MYSERELRRMKAAVAGRMAFLRLRRFVKELWGFVAIAFVSTGIVAACARFWYWLFW